jgi:hypothetical protein
MPKKKLKYRVCIDLPPRVKKVKNYLEEKLDCDIMGVTPVRLSKKFTSESLFNRGNFKRYDVSMEFSSRNKDLGEYIENKVYCNVVSYLKIRTKD